MTDAENSPFAGLHATLPQPDGFGTVGDDVFPAEPNLSCSTLDYFPTVQEVVGYQMPGKPRPMDGVNNRVSAKPSKASPYKNRRYRLQAPCNVTQVLPSRSFRSGAALQQHRFRDKQLLGSIDD